MDSQPKGKPFDAAKYYVVPSEMIRYMAAHFDTTVCPQCGKDDGWEMDGQENQEGVTQLIVYRLTYAESTGIFRPFFSMNCSACGSIRQIIGDNVVGWLSEKPKESTNE